MDFNLFDKVQIKDKGVTGTIVDIFDGDNGQPVYVVQSNNSNPENRKDAYPGEYPLFDCAKNQLIRI